MILVKFATRQRFNIFFNTLNQYIKFADNIDDMYFLISLDLNDRYMNNENTKNHFNKLIKNGIKLKYIYRQQIDKIDAINRDINLIDDWNILLTASDDMIPQIKGYDTIIKDKFKENFSNGDGALWFYDGMQKKVCTLSIMDKNFYKRFNYIYHPSYHSFYCDNEFTEVATKLNKLIFINQVIIKHEHYTYNGIIKKDDLYSANKKYWNIDKMNYNNRKANNFN